MPTLKQAVLEDQHLLTFQKQSVDVMGAERDVGEAVHPVPPPASITVPIPQGVRLVSCQRMRR